MSYIHKTLSLHLFLLYMANHDIVVTNNLFLAWVNLLENKVKLD